MRPKQGLRRDDRKLLMKFHRPWYRRPVVWAFLTIPAVMFLRLIATPVAWHYTKARLAHLPDFDVSFSGLSLGFLAGDVLLRDVAVRRRDAAAGEPPLANARFVHAELPLSRLLLGGRLDRLTIHDPVVRLETGGDAVLSDVTYRRWLNELSRLPAREIGAVRVERATVLTAEHARDPRAHGGRALFRALNLKVEGWGAAGAEVPIRVEARGHFLGTGDVECELVVRQDEPHDFRALTTLSGLTLADVYAFAFGRVPPDAPGGKVRVVSEMAGDEDRFAAKIEAGAYEILGEVAHVALQESLAARVPAVTGLSLRREGKVVEGQPPPTMAAMRIASSVSAGLLEGLSAAVEPPDPCELAAAGISIGLGEGLDLAQAIEAAGVDEALLESCPDLAAELSPPKG
jgi:hypothetical protein